MSLQWIDWVLKPAPPLGAERLAEVRERLGFIFPEAYVEVVRTHQGPTPNRRLVTLSDGSRTTLSMLLHFEDHPEGLNVLDILDWSELFPEKVIPFAVDPGGNYFCFDYRATDVDPPVTFLAHDEIAAEPEFVATSFTKLIASLQPR